MPDEALTLLFGSGEASFSSAAIFTPYELKFIIFPQYTFLSRENPRCIITYE